MDPDSRPEDQIPQAARDVRRCWQCGGEAVPRISDGGGELLDCPRCGVGVRPAGEILAELRHEIQLLKDELNRLRQAVNFLNQRVR